MDNSDEHPSSDDQEDSQSDSDPAVSHSDDGDGEDEEQQDSIRSPKILDTPNQSKNPAQLTKKQILNNHIVGMRKSVRQARVQIINKLTREIKRLRNRKGVEEKQAKALKKAERFVQEIQAIRTLKQDQVSISALQTPHSSLEEELKSNPNLEPQIRAIARLNHHPIIVAEVKKYRESNPHWALQIPVLLEKSKEKQKLTERKEKKKLIEVKSPVSKSAITPKQESKEAIAAEPQKPKKSSVPKVLPKLEKSQGTIKVQILQDLADLEEERETIPIKAAAQFVPAVPTAPKSSFFLGGIDSDKSDDSAEFEEPESKFRSGPKFDRKSKPTYSNNQATRDRNSKPVFRKGKLINPPPNKKSFGVGNKGPRGSAKFEKSFGSKNSNFAPVGAKAKSFDKSSAPAAPLTEKLHPSWEAKKRQSSQSLSISSFKGKKIKFSDD